ncbi:AMP-binding protein [Bacillus piscicola]|uniref:AMP-binding protein n=1 Tax=Bacillus piscicola TaxID=1632684 RepID=UPI001F08A67B|nr:AMP-binding protein [Bacillus piscicola]
MDIMGERTIIDLLHEKCEQHRDKTFLLFEDNDQKTVKYTYNEFLDRVNRFSCVLLDFGIKKGDRVTLHLPNSSDFIVSWFALANIGAIMVPTNVLSTASEMEYLMGHSESVMLVTEEEYLDKFESIKNNLPRMRNILLTRCYDKEQEHVSVNALIEKASSQVPEVEIRGEDVVAILYTSGTTSKPKGCLITHTNYLYTGEAVSKSIRFSPDDRALIVLPLFHGNGQYYLFMPALTVGGSIAITERFSASQYIKQTKRLGATLGSLFAAPIRMILAQTYDREDRDNFLRLVIFAQAVTPEEVTDFEEKFQVPLLQLYGMTETVAPPLMNPLDGKKDNTSIGRPIITATIKTLNETGQETQIGEPGEIVVKGIPGRTIMKGYFKNEEETNQMIQNGWLHTGDKARRSEEGLFYFVDRQKDMIKRAGENVAASEVENVLMEHPAVYESAVIGIPDPIRDEAIKAFVIVKEGRSISEEKLIDFCRERMAKFKVPDVIELVEDFPRTSVGKIQKHQLRKRGV